MKNLILLICLVSPILSFSQAWAPFRFDQATIYATYDSLGPIFKGNMLTTVKFDTMVQGQDFKEYYNPNHISDSGRINAFRFYQSVGYTMLFGKKIIEKSGVYIFQPLFSNQDTVKYYPNADFGEVGIRIGTEAYLFSAKEAKIIEGVVDSVKRCQFELGGDQFFLEASKYHGILSLPNFFTSVNPLWIPESFTFLGSKRQYKRMGLLNEITGLMSFSLNRTKFHEGDTIQVIGENDSYMTPNKDTVIISVDSVWSDSCRLAYNGHLWQMNWSPSSGSIYDTTFNNYITSRNVLNNPSLHRQDSIYSRFPGDYIPLKGFQRVLVTRENLMFYGIGDIGCYHCSFPMTSLFAERLPIFYDHGNITGFFNESFKRQTVFFKRGDTLLGNFYPLNYTSIRKKSREGKSISVFPNPVSAQLFVSGMRNANLKIVIYDFQGRKLIDQRFFSESGISVRELPPGLYFYQVFVGDLPHARFGSFQKN